MKVLDILQPRWKIPEYTKREINEAGNTIRNDSATDAEKASALEIIDNWRAAHAYPLHVFYMNLRSKAGNRTDIIVAERLKRMNSIVEKLRRENSMELYRMQDLGGCRMVVPTLEEVYKFSKRFMESRIRHERKNIKDYIQTPKRSGYRSLHLIYKFRSDTPEKSIYNQYPMLIELQFRTHLQHIWATALETIGLFKNQALKAGQGSKEILRFFIVISSLFAIREGCQVVPGTSMDKDQLISEIEQINNQYHVLDMLSAISVIVEHDGNRIPDKKGYYILQLDYEKRLLKRLFFKPSKLEEANRCYDRLESLCANKPLDTVMVRASSFSTVKAAFPNYFMDIGEFIEIVKSYMNH